METSDTWLSVVDASDPNIGYLAGDAGLATGSAGDRTESSDGDWSSEITECNVADLGKSLSLAAAFVRLAFVSVGERISVVPMFPVHVPTVAPS